MNISSLCKRLALIIAILMLSQSASACAKNKEPADTTMEETVPGTTSSDTTFFEEEPQEITYTLPQSASKDGRLLREYSYSQNGLTMIMTDLTEETPITYTVTFDGEGRPLYTEWVIAVNNIRTEKWKDEYILDDNGNIVTEKRYCEGVLQFTYTYTYDENGNILTQRSQKEYGKNKSFTDYVLTYDSHNTCVSITSSLNGVNADAYKESLENKYDDNGRITESKSDSYTVVYEYTDKDGLLTNEKVTYKSNDFSWSYYYQYTYENGKLIKEDCSYNGILTDTTLYTQSTCAHYADAIEWIFRERLP